jgi:hypothetical protein
VLITALGSWEKPVPRGHMIRERDPEGRSTVMVTALGRGKQVPHGYMISVRYVYTPYPKHILTRSETVVNPSETVVKRAYAFASTKRKTSRSTLLAPEMFKAILTQSCVKRNSSE